MDTRRTGLAALLVSVAIAGPAEAQNEEPYLDEGACPFECCTYRAWVAREVVTLYARPDSESVEVGALQPGDTVTAETGHTVTVPAPFVLRRVVRQHNREFVVGDTLWVLSYQGEGFFKIRYDGKVITNFELGFSPQGGSSGTRCENCAIGQLEHELETVWWARLVLPDGTVGWTNQPFTFDGNDACGDAADSASRMVVALPSGPYPMAFRRATRLAQIS